MANGFKIDISDALRGLGEVNSKFIKAGKLYGDTAGKMMVADAKKNAPWTDRTALSRQTIDNAVLDANGGIEIVLRGNTDQFKYLELAHEKKYAILMPTLEKWRGKVLIGWSNVLNKVR